MKNKEQLTRLNELFGSYRAEWLKGKVFCIKGVQNSERLPLITDAVMTLALIRIPGNKLNDEANTKETMYMIHPIYAPYFVYSHRKKRKLDVTEQELMDIIQNKRETIKSIYTRCNVTDQDSKYLPEQMTLFDNYYNG